MCSQHCCRFGPASDAAAGCRATCCCATVRQPHRLVLPFILTHGSFKPSPPVQSAAEEQFNVVLTITTLTACEQFKPAEDASSDTAASAPAPAARRMLKA